MNRVTCGLFPGANARRDLEREIPDTATGDEVAALLAQPIPTVDVHVHRGMDPADGSTHRWEDPPEDEFDPEVAAEESGRIAHGEGQAQ